VQQIHYFPIVPLPRPHAESVLEGSQIEQCQNRFS
jgi:hypothetical protein